MWKICQENCFVKKGGWGGESCPEPAFNKYTENKLIYTRGPLPLEIWHLMLTQYNPNFEHPFPYLMLIWPQESCLYVSCPMSLEQKASGILYYDDLLCHHKWKRWTCSCLEPRKDCSDKSTSVREKIINLTSSSSVYACTTSYHSQYCQASTFLFFFPFL